MYTYVISDTHFYHQKMIEYEGRPENFTELIQANWNKVVQPEDIVIHLGDVILGNMSDLKNINDRLYGIKILVKGSHDEKSYGWYISNGFTFVCDSLVWKNILLTHVPVSKDVVNNYIMNVHGHLHSGKHRTDDFEYIKNKYINVSVEVINYTPVRLDLLLKGRD